MAKSDGDYKYRIQKRAEELALNDEKDYFEIPISESNDYYMKALKEYEDGELL